jgi:hypothetical protein
MKRFAPRVLLHVVMPIALGGALYLSFRNDDIALFRWVEALGLGHALDAARTVTRRLLPWLPRVVLGSAPDMAWAWAFGAALAMVWRAEPATIAARAWLGAGFAIAVGIEVGQGLGIVPGVFDPVDLVAIGVGYASGAHVVLRAGRHADVRQTRVLP